MTDPITRLNVALEGRYRVEREIGEGGMATVYLAEDLRHERKVALKVLKPELAAVVGAERFLAEIKTTANLQHPHILPLFDSGQVESFLYYVMPYVEGESLRERLDREHQLPVDEAVQIATNMAEALDYAHRQGVIHRDIKPANVLMLDGKPVISDFGIALAVGAAGGGRLTETGLSLGTPHYMSPEQATGDQNVGPQTDTYALGCVLYEMLVGEPPYTGPNAQAVLAQIITAEAVSPAKKRSSIPPNVDAAIRKALEKLPADRFASAHESAAALNDPGFRHREVGVVRRAAISGLWNPLSVLTTVSTIIFALGLGWSLLRSEPLQSVSRQVLSTQGWDGLGTELGRYSALAPDGSSMILPLRGQLGLKMRGSTEITPIPGTEGGRDVVYSPDGQWIAYASGSNLFKRPIIGGSPVRLAEDVQETQRVALAWLDDGTILYEADAPLRMVQIPENGGDPRVVMDPANAWWADGLPNGRGALVVTNDRGLHVVDLQGPSSKLILEQAMRAWYASTGHLVYVRDDGALFAVPFDIDELTITGGATPLLEGVRVTANRADMRLGADGTLLYVEGPSVAEGRELLVVDLEGNEEVLPLAPRVLNAASWSPDGESIAFSSQGQIYTYNVSLGTTPRQVTFEGDNQEPVYSPDGTRIAFSSQRVGTGGTDGYDLFMKTLNDDSPATSIISLEGDQWLNQWPSDTLLVFESLESGTRDLWMVNLSDPDGTKAEVYLSSEGNLFDQVVSPDGTLAAYASQQSGVYQIYLRSFPDPGQPAIVSQDGGDVSYWSPDGRTLYYTSGTNGDFTMMAARLELEPVPVVLSRDSLFAVFGLWPFQGSGLHPDGDRWVIARDVGAAVAEAPTSRPHRLILVNNFFEELRRVVPDN